MPEGYDRVTAVRYLCGADPLLGAHIAATGPCTLRPAPDAGPHTLFDRLASSILSQQLSVKAAATIAGRLRERAGAGGLGTPVGAAGPGAARPPHRVLDPDRVSALTDEELRGCGISRPKVAALRDLADAVRSGRIPTLEVLRGYDDDDVVDALTEVRGIGRWAAEMQLIFLLDRPDVFPLADVGVRRGFERVLGPEPGLDPEASLDPRATTSRMLEHSQVWAPYRSVASWYLWRAVDQTGQSVPPA